jgi:hypothetical protein
MAPTMLRNLRASALCCTRCGGARARPQAMVATATGVVATVYEGAAQRCRAGGLKPGGEYIFCVKATYDDGSAVWSAPKAFHMHA